MSVLKVYSVFRRQCPYEFDCLFTINLGKNIFILFIVGVKQKDSLLVYSLFKREW